MVVDVFYFYASDTILVDWSLQIVCHLARYDVFRASSTITRASDFAVWCKRLQLDYKKFPLCTKYKSFYKTWWITICVVSICEWSLARTVVNLNMLVKRILLVLISPCYQRKSDICFSCRTSCYVVGWCHEMTKKATKTQKLCFMLPGMLIIFLLKFLHLSFIKVQFLWIQKHLARYRTEGCDQNSSFTLVKWTNIHV